MAEDRPKLRFLRESFPDRPAFGTAVSDAILRRVASGELPGTMRLHRPGPELALSKQDANSPGFERAIAAGRDAGFTPVLRLAGGRAAAFHEGTLALARATYERYPPRTTQDRFVEVSAAITAALRELGVDARVGEVPGEYCPGAWSINARAAIKLVGIGQRLISGGAHVGVVVVVSGSERIRALLEPVYEALDLEWDPDTVGSVEDEIGPVSLEDVEEAIVAQVRKAWDLTPATLDDATLTLAEGFAEAHDVG